MWDVLDSPSERRHKTAPTRKWRNGRRTRLRIWRVTPVEVQVLSSAESLLHLRRSKEPQRNLGLFAFGSGSTFRFGSVLWRHRDVSCAPRQHETGSHVAIAEGLYDYDRDRTMSLCFVELTGPRCGNARPVGSPKVRQTCGSRDPAGCAGWPRRKRAWPSCDQA